MGFERLLALKASAGSGKTFSLSVRYLSLLFLGADPEKIYTLTFTNKAANEMRERITSLLENLQNKDAELKEISYQTGLSKEVVLKELGPVYKKFIDSNPKIMTIDKFINLILRQFAINIGLLSNFEIEDPDEEVLMLNFLKEIYSSNLNSELISFAVKENIKIESLHSFFKELYEKDKEIMPFISRITSSSEIDTSVFEENTLKIMDSIKSFVKTCKNASATAINSVEYKNIDDILKKSWITRDTLNYRTFKKCYTPELDELFFELKDSIKNYMRAKEHNFILGLSKLYSHYKKISFENRAKHNRLTFSDVTNFVYDLLYKENIPNPFLYFRLDSKIDHLLIDEFQDTSIVQYKILEPVIEEIVQSTEFRSFFYVGDTKQSIYRFRGSNWMLFDYVANKFPITVKSLKYNFRSTPVVVDFVNETFSKLFEGYEPQLSYKESPEGMVKIVNSENLLEDAKKSIELLLSKNVSPKNIAVLVFTNDEVVDVKNMIEDSFSVAVVTDTSAKLINQRSVRAIYSLVKHIYFEEEIYLSEFLAAMGYYPKVRFNLDKNYFKRFKKPSELLKNLVDKLELFNGDPNILKLIDVSRGYETIEDFIFGFEKISTSMANIENVNGIRVMTIHKSKGLQFGHVIVLDKSRENNIPKKLIFDYEGIALENIRYRFKNRELFDDGYKDSLEKEKRLEYIDLLNTIYVALTRAENSLIVIKKPEKSAFETILHKGVEMGSIEGDKEEVAVSPKPLFEFDEVYYGKQRFVKKIKEENNENSYFGSAFHYAMEIMDNFAEESANDAVAAAINKYGIYLDNLQIEDLKNRVFAIIKDKEFKNLIKNRKIQKEIPVVLEGQVGYIDLLIEDGDKCIVVDYKTGNHSIDHKLQIKKYCQAIEKIKKKQTIGLLFYANSNKICFSEV